MTKKFCYNAKNGEIFSYIEEGEYNDFPRGTFLAYQDYLTTGLKSKEKAEEWAAEWSECPGCESQRHGKHGEICVLCGETLINHFVKAEETSNTPRAQLASNPLGKGRAP